MHFAFYSLLLSVILTFQNCYCSTSVSFVRVENSAEIQALNNLGIVTTESVTICASICATRDECDAYSFNRNEYTQGTCTLMQITPGSPPSETISKISGLYMKEIPKPIIAQTDEEFTTQISTLTPRSNDPGSTTASPNGAGSTTSLPINSVPSSTAWPNYPGFNTSLPNNTWFNTEYWSNNYGPNTPLPNNLGQNTKPTQTVTFPDFDFDKWAPQTSSTKGPRNLNIQCSTSSGLITALMTVLDGLTRVTYIFFNDGTFCKSVNGGETCEYESESAEASFESINLDKDTVQMAFSTDSQRVILGDGEQWYWFIQKSDEFSFKKTIDDVGQCKSWLSGFVSGSIFNSTAIMFASNGDISCYPQNTIQQSLDSNTCQALKSAQNAMCDSIHSALQNKNLNDVDAIEEQISGTLTIIADSSQNCKISS